MEKSTAKSVMTNILFGIILILLNVTLMMIIGYLTIDSNANLNSRIGAYLLSVLIPYFIVSNSRGMTGFERVFKFGLGYMVYLFFVLIKGNLTNMIMAGILPCLLISLVLLYLGNYFHKEPS